MKRMTQNSRWLLAAALITMATLALFFAPSAEAAARPGDSAWSRALPDQRIFNEDLLVADGQVINDNVAVLNGDVTIRAGGVINGDLSVVRGAVNVAGQIRGNLAIVQGDATLRSSARIEGDVSVVGGKVDRAPGAFVGGNFVGGAGQDWGGFFGGNDGSDVGKAPSFRGDGASRSWLANLFWRLVQAILWTLLITGLVVLIVWLAPAQVRQVAHTAETEPALSFAVGLVVALVVTFLSIGLFATICLAPAAVLLSGLLAIVALVGWAATALWIGERLANLSAGGSVSNIPGLVFVGLAALVLTGVTSFAWALLTCIGLILALLLVSPGVGAVLVNLARRSGRGRGPTSEAATAAAQDPAAEDADGVFTGDELGLSESERSALQAGAREAVQGDADFTRLRGIGPAFDRRLKEAGVTTFAALAAMTPDEVSAIIGWPPERVVRDQLLEQAAELAAQS